MDVTVDGGDQRDSNVPDDLGPQCDPGEVANDAGDRVWDGVVDVHVGFDDCTADSLVLRVDEDDDTIRWLDHVDLRRAATVCVSLPPDHGLSAESDDGMDEAAPFRLAWDLDTLGTDDSPRSREPAAELRVVDASGTLGI